MVTCLYTINHKITYILTYTRNVKNEQTQKYNNTRNICMFVSFYVRVFCVRAWKCVLLGNAVPYVSLCVGMCYVPTLKQTRL